jgi:hypothetical protein
MYNLQIRREVPKAPKKIQRESKVLNFLIDEYNKNRNNSTKEKLEGLVINTFKYLELAFEDNKQYKEYFDELKSVLRERYGINKLHLVYDLLQLLENAVGKTENERNEDIIRKFQGILDEIKDDEEATPLTDEDLDNLVHYVKDNLIGDDVKHGPQLRSIQGAFDKLGVGGRKTRKNKNQKRKYTNKNLKQKKRNNKKINKRKLKTHKNKINKTNRKPRK